MAQNDGHKDSWIPLDSINPAVAARIRSLQPEPPGQQANTGGRALGLQKTDPAAAIDSQSEPLVLPKARGGVRLAPGDLLGKYQIIRELGRGGMGAVFLARDTRLGRRVALKVLKLQGKTFGQRFIVEARTTARCNHDNIVVIHEADEYRGMHYMVLEYLEGQTLRELLEASVSDGVGQNGPLSPERAVELTIPIVRALIHAHEMGIVHRDLKPENVMLTHSGAIKVLDFGIAKLLAATEERAPSPSMAPGMMYGRMSVTGALNGTLPYMSPEQLRAEPQIDHRSDIWAVGIMLYEMVTGQHPLDPLSPEKYQAIAWLDTPMPSLSQLHREFGALGSIVDRCLLKAKESRTDNARALLEELEQIRPHKRAVVLGVDQSPFAGLASYQEADAPRFFGRSQDIANVVTRVRNQSMVAVIGPSGVGKSSLVRAGVIPALKRSGEGWTATIVRPGRQPLAALAQLMNQFQWAHETSDSFPLRNYTSTEVVDSVAQLRAQPGVLGTTMRAWAYAKLRRVLVFVDQFEELFTLTPDPAERQIFMNCLTGIGDDESSPLRVIFSMRADFVEQMARERTFMSAATGSMVFLSPIGRDGLRQALSEPLAAANYQFEDESIITEMLDTLDSTRGALPLLQFTASKLWEARDRQRRLITRASYQAIGGISGALSKHADAVLAGMHTTRRALTREILERLVTPERTRAIVSVDELRELPAAPGEVDQVLHELTQARLLLLDIHGAAARTVELVHESLIGSWQTLRRWLDENQDDAAFLARLRTASKEWEQSGRPEGLLWRGEVAEDAAVWHKRYNKPLGERERRFLQEVFALTQRAVRRRRTLAYAGVALLVLLLVAAGFALFSIQRAERDARAKAAALDVALESERTEKEAAVEAQRRALLSKQAADTAKQQEEEAKELALKEKELAEAAGERAQAAERRALRDKARARRAERRARRAQRRALRDKARAEAAERQAREAEQIAKQKTERVERLVSQLKKIREEQDKLIDKYRREYDIPEPIDLRDWDVDSTETSP